MRFGSAFEITVPARSEVPSSSVTPAPGTISDTGTPQASTAPASRAASAIAKLTIPMPPSTYPQSGPWPSMSPWKCMSLIEAVPWSLGPPQVPMIPCPNRAVFRRSSER